MLSRAGCAVGPSVFLILKSLNGVVRLSGRQVNRQPARPHRKKVALHHKEGFSARFGTVC